MPMFPCPHCKNECISLRQKFLAGKWIDVICPNCGGRSCIFPALLVVLYFFYTWDVMLFGYVAVLKHSLIYVGVMITGWLFLEVCSLYLPLAAMKARPAAPT